jgi:5-(carboxyamino)imidazole ribonucleotide synthase
VITVGVLGGGQLGRMLGLAGIPLGLRFRFLDPAANPPAAAVGEHIRAGFEDPRALAALRLGADVITYEFEGVPLAAVEALGPGVTVRPGPAALRVMQDRLEEKRFVRSLGIEVAPFAEVKDAATLESALREVGAPSRLKSRRGGYDGRGQARIDSPRDAAAAWREVGEIPAVLERHIPFRREIAIIAVRGTGGEQSLYPLVETRHRDGILAAALAPAPGVDEAIRRQARQISRRILEALDYVGVLAIECFELDGRLIVNELAPRVHNSGHWTIEGAATSQFENHLRAIAGLPLGSTRGRGMSGLVNLLGAVPERSDLLAVPGAHLHLYDKPAAPGRKLGHVTVRAAGREQLARRMLRVESLIETRAAGGAR